MGSDRTNNIPLIYLDTSSEDEAHVGGRRSTRKVLPASLQKLFSSPSPPFQAVPLGTEALQIDLVTYVQLQVAKAIFFDPTQPRPALLWHGTGAGKTRAALLIALHIPLTSTISLHVDSKQEFSKVDFVTRKAVAEQWHFQKELVRLVACEWYKKYQPAIVHFLQKLALSNLRQKQDELERRLSIVQQTGVVTNDLAKAFWPPLWRVLGHDAFLRESAKILKTWDTASSSSHANEACPPKRLRKARDVVNARDVPDVSPEARLHMDFLESFCFRPPIDLDEPTAPTHVDGSSANTTQKTTQQTTTPRYLILDEAQLCATTFDNHSTKPSSQTLLDLLQHPQSHVSLLAALSATPAPNLRETAWGLLALLWTQTQRNRGVMTSSTTKEQTHLTLLNDLLKYALKDIDEILEPNNICGRICNKEGETPDIHSAQSYIEQMVANILQKQPVRDFIRAFKCQISWFPKSLLQQTRMEEVWDVCPTDLVEDRDFWDMYENYEQRSFHLTLDAKGSLAVRPRKRGSQDKRKNDDDDDGTAFFADLRQAANTFCETSPSGERLPFSSSNHPSGPKLRFLGDFIAKHVEEIVRDTDPLRIVIYSNYTALGVAAVLTFLQMRLQQEAQRIHIEGGDAKRAGAMKKVREERLHMFAGGVNPTVIQAFNDTNKTEATMREDAVVEAAIETAVAAFNGHRKGGIMLLSSRGSEGIEIKDVDHLFLLESQWNMERTEQIIGRVVRYGSHRQDRGDRPVYVHHLLLRKPFPKGILRFIHWQGKEVSTTDPVEEDADNFNPRVAQQSPIVVCEDGENHPRASMGLGIDAMLTRLANVKVREALSLHLLLVLCTLQYNMSECYADRGYDLGQAAVVQNEVKRCFLKHITQVCLRSAKVGQTIDILQKALQESVLPMSATQESKSTTGL